MKILDVGAHDGYLSTWIGRQLDAVDQNGGDPVDFQIDGIELNPAAVELANRRLDDSGVPGKFVQGRAEDVGGFFAQGTYDAVLCFELLEHVPDVNALLSACEVMLKPGGRVYLSTPDGVFGTGSNPNHLRVWSASQLADLVRERGDVIDFNVGHDGISFAAYTPTEKQGRVTIHTGTGWEPWGPMDISNKGLGGSETAAVRLGMGLAELGWVPTIYGSVAPGYVKNVMYRPEQAWDPTELADLFVTSRIPELVDARPNATKVALWLHDVDCGPRLTAERAERIDHVLVLSEWHRDHVAELYPFVADKLVQIRNGIHREYFADTPLTFGKRDPLLLYTSSPDRGLDLLLTWWPEILARCRDLDVDAHFAFCYAPVYEKIAKVNPQVAQFAEHIAALVAGCENVDQMPGQPQPNIAKIMGNARVWAHPSWTSDPNAGPGTGQPFYETSCIGAMEAQAAGCRVIASNRGALPETVRSGKLIGARDRPQEHPDVWRAEWIDAIVEGLCNPSGTAPSRIAASVADLGWDGVARLVADL